MEALSLNAVVSSGKYENERLYWMDRLQGILDLSTFPVDNKRELLQKNSPLKVDFNFSDGLCERMITVSKNTDYALFLIFLSGVKYLLHRYNLSKDVLVVQPVFKQNESDVSQLINRILLLRTNVEKDYKFKMLLSALKETVSEANKNQNYPLLNIIGRLDGNTGNQKRGLPCVGIMFDGIHDISYLHDIEMDILFRFSKKEERISLEVTYNSLLYKEEKINEIIKKLNKYYEYVLTNTDTSMDEVDIFSKEESNRLEHEVSVAGERIFNILINNSNGLKVKVHGLGNEEKSLNEGDKDVGEITNLEKDLIEIWKGVLGRVEVKVYEDFFNLGGNSLKSVALVNEIKERFGIELPVLEIFKGINVRSLAQLIEENDKYVENKNEGHIEDAKLEEQVKEEDCSDEEYCSDKNSYPVRKKQKVVMQREITNFLHRSLPLCTVLAYECYKPWYYCNYIQVFSCLHEDGGTEINYLEPRDSFEEVMELITLGFHMLNKEKNIIDFIKEKINLGYTIIFNIDEYELKNKEDYLKNHYVHPSLIYGYDDESKKLSAIGFNKERLFIELEFSYNEFYKSYESAKIHYQDYAPWCEWSAVQLIKPRILKPFPFSVDKFMKDLYSYIYAKGDNYRLYSFNYDEKRVKYGMDVYSVFVEGMKKVLQGEVVIDYRALHSLCEHKKCLYDRISYVIEKYELNDHIKEKNESFMKLVEKFDQLRLKFLKQLVANLDINNLMPEQKAVVEEVTNEILELAREEFIILEEIYKHLADCFSYHCSTGSV